MKKIAFVIRLLQKDNFHGGGEKLFYNLIKRFSAANYEIDIYCNKSDIEHIDGINKIVVVNKHYDHLKPETMEDFYSEVKNLVKNENYDFVISENITPPVDITFLQGHSLVNRLKRDKNPLEAFFYNFRKVKQERIKFHKKWFKEGYRKIFVVSEVLKRDIVDNYGISEDKIAVIYPGVDILQTINTSPTNCHSELAAKQDEPESRSFMPLPGDSESSQQEIKSKVVKSQTLNQVQGDKTQIQQHETQNDMVITFGLAAPGFKIKGGFIFLKALGILKKQGHDFKAKIIYPKYSKNLGVKLLVKLLNIEKNVEFLPYQENIQEFYKSIDVLVAPSIEDTFNLAVLEAMANYRLCIVSINAGASEIIKDGENGFVFDMKGCPQRNLANKMNFLINNPDKYNDICAKAFETAKYYSWQRTFENFVEELEKIDETNFK